jgi:pimeloyl-ACP methyl ester carboxylesterase
MQSLLGGAELQILDRAAHTPFLSHPKETQDLLSDFWFRNASIR